MKFYYQFKKVHTAEEYIDFLKEGYVNVNFGDAYALPREHVYKETNLFCQWLVSRQHESPMIAWRYAKALLQELDETLPFEQDLDKAYDILIDLAQQDFAPAMHQLASYYTNHAFKNDEQQAQFWMDKAIQQNYGTALFEKACNLYFLRKNRQEGFELFLRAWQEGYPRAIYYVAKHYLDSDSNLALQYYEKGMDEEDWQCAYEMACFYHEGKLVPQDYCKAEDLYKKCILWYLPNYEYSMLDSNILGKAYYALGNLHEQSLLPNSSMEQALCYFESSADYGFADSAYKVARMYEQGVGTKINLPKAAEFYRLSVGSTAKDNSMATTVKEALVRICQQLEKKESNFLSQALAYLGQVYQICHDYPNAEECYQKALTLGLIDAGFELKQLDRIQGKPPRYIPQIDDPISNGDIPF